MITLSGLAAASVVACLHRGIPRRYQGRFAIQPEVGCADLVSAFVQFNLPGVVAVAMKDRFIINAEVIDPDSLSLRIIGGAKDRYADCKRGGLSVQTDVGRRRLIPLTIVLRYETVVAILMQDWLPLRSVVRNSS